MPINLDEKILSAAMRAEFRLKQTLERLEWEENVLKPALANVRNAPMEPGKERIISVSFDEGKTKRKTR